MAERDRATRNPLSGYGVALLATAVATLARVLLDPLLGDALPFVTYFVAALVTGWFVGGRPAALVIALGLVVGLALFLEPTGLLTLRRQNDLVRVFLYLLVGMTIAGLTGSVRVAWERARAAAAAAAENEQRYERLVAVLPVAVLLNKGGRITFANPAALALFGAERGEQIVGRSVFDLFHPDDHGEMRERMEALRRGDEIPVTERRIVRLDGGLADVAGVGAMYSESGEPVIEVVLHDITERKRAEAEVRRVNEGLEERVRERTRELQEALDSVRRLQGLLPICAWCKKVRDDQDYWHEVESYVTRHSEARFSHGICPACYDQEMGKLKAGAESPPADPPRVQ